MEDFAAFSQLKFEQGADSPFPEELRQVLTEYIRQTAFKRILHQFMKQVSAAESKSVSVLSAYPGEGKTFFVSVLALGLAQFLGQKVLIVDSVAQTKGKSLYFQGLLGEVLPDMPRDGNERGVIELLSTDSGTSDTNDTADFQLAKYFTGITGEYDLMLVDTCSIFAAESSNLDPLILAGNTDASLLVTSPRSLIPETAQSLADELGQFDVNLIGSVFNEGAPRIW